MRMVQQRCSAFVLWVLALACCLLMGGIWSASASAKGRYGQLVLEFTGKKIYSHSYDEGQHSVVLEIAKADPTELGALERYDERLVKRVLVKDLGAAGVEVRLFLKDRNVLATVSSFEEPFRIVVDMFDNEFRENHDPVTGLPLLADGSTPDGVAGTPAVATTARPMAAAPIPSEPASESSSGTARRLLQPSPVQMETPAEVARAFDGIATGPGKGWDSFPPYVYRVQTAAYTGERAGREPAIPQSTLSMRTMAVFAGGLFDYGHEGRALAVYNQVLHREPQVFDNEPLHLWRLAEIHMGQANMTLAGGYYLALIERHPASPLARFAALRRLDIEAVYAARRKDSAVIEGLLPKLVAIDPAGNSELKAQVATRYAFWKRADGMFDNGYVPVIDDSARSWLKTARTQVESRRTAFLVDTLLLADMIRPDFAWTKNTAEFAASYFDKFKGGGSEPFYGTLEQRTRDRVAVAIKDAASRSAWADCVEVWESLPRSLKDVAESAQVSWSVAEAYRNLGQNDRAVGFYGRAAKTFEQAVDRFRARFWQAVAAGDAAEARKQARGDDADTRRLMDTSSEADRVMKSTWDGLEAGQKRETYTAMREPIEKAAVSTVMLKSPPAIVLEMWSGALSTETAGQSADFSGPRGVILLTGLRDQFGKIGRADDARRARELLKKIDAKSVATDKAARKVWGDEMNALAEEERKASNYLEAGRLYGVVGKEDVSPEGKAAALYKSGLLLYRAGQREEAIANLRKAAEDPNDLHYAELAKQRLSQLEK